MNRVIMKGRVGGEVEYRLVGAKNTPLAKCSLAVADKLEPKNNDKTYWASLVVWGKLADVFNDHVTKGQELLIEGRISRASWEKDGVKHHRDEVIVESMWFCGKPQGKKQSSTPEDIDDDIPF